MEPRDLVSGAAHAPPTPTPREPESEDSALSSRAPSPADEPKALEDDDVVMECDEAAEDSGATDEDEEEEERRVAAAYCHAMSRGALHAVDTTPVREYPEEYAKYQMPEKEAAILSSGVMMSPLWSGKRKRSDADAADLRTRMAVEGIDMAKGLSVTVKRKGSSDFLRKGQWTPTEERLARLLIEAFEEGYLPIYTGIRLRGYLAVQLQCDPMRVSKKLCAGTIDGKKIPKNYGQKKFRLRKKLLWDREEAGRVLATLERLTKELWAETGISPPHYLTLSTTRNADEESSPSSVTLDGGRTQSSPVKKLSPPSNKSKKQKGGVVFPIIYLNLSKKLKQGQAGTNGQAGSTSFMYDNVIRHYGGDSTYVQNPDGSIQIVGYATSHNDSDSSSSSSSDKPVKVDGESLQAAYELLNLHQHCLSPTGSSTSRGSTPSSPAASGHQELLQLREGQAVVPIRPTPSKPSILRQLAPTVAS